MTNTINELTLCVGNAYNARSGNFLTEDVFLLTYDEHHSVDWDTGTRDTPDQVSASGGTHYTSVKSTLLMETEADYDREFSAAVGAEYTGVTYSGSAKSTLLYHGALFSSSSCSYTLNYYLQSVLTFNRRPVRVSDINPEFATDLKALPDPATAGHEQKYFAFFDKYGTHYATFGTLGGTIFMETQINDSLINSSTTVEVTAAVSVGYQSVVQKGKLDVEAAYKASDYLQQHRNQISIELNVLGGLFSPDETISNWQQSLYRYPSVVLNTPNSGGEFTTFACISKLAPIVSAASYIAPAIERLLPAYLAQDLEDDGLIGSAKSLRLSQVYDERGLGDGFVLATIGQTGNGCRGYLVSSDDFTSNPTINRSLASQHYYTDRDHRIPSGCLTMPAPAASSFVTGFQATSGGPSVTLNYLSLGNVNERTLGQWQDVTLGQTITATSDGFAVAWINSMGRNGARGEIWGRRMDGTELMIAAASQHYFTNVDLQVPCNSFCMPVRKGESYRVDLMNTAFNPDAKAYFLPMADTLYLFKESESRVVNQQYKANTDGMLVACMSARGNGQRGQIWLHSYPDADLLIQNGFLASTSVHYYTDTDTHVPVNSATIPVARGNSYKVTLGETSGNPDVQLRWYPLARK